MTRKIFLAVYLLTSLVIGLGAFGHDSNARHLSDEFAKFPAFDARIASITLAVWHFCSGCMLVFGVICIRAWWQARQGARDVFFAPIVIGVFYLVTGLATVVYTGIGFFWLFVVLGGSLLVSSIALRRNG